MNSKTATVEILTAELRVLKVGSRQVTLSVYGQLDAIDIENIEPFGRVRPGFAQEGWLYLIGSNCETGELARSRVPTDLDTITQVASRTISRLRQIDNETKKIRTEMHDLNIKLKSTQKCASYRQPGMPEQRISEIQTDLVRLRQPLELLTDEWTTLIQPWIARAAKLAELPLIVLGGLR